MLQSLFDFNQMQIMKPATPNTAREQYQTKIQITLPEQEPNVHDSNQDFNLQKKNS